MNAQRGTSPHGCESLLAYHRERLSHGHDDEDPATLSHDECVALQRESVQYYHRRMALLRVGEFAAAAADAEHNLATMDLLRDHAANRADWRASEQFRAFVLAHWTRARLLQALSEADVEQAVVVVDEGITAIERLQQDDPRRPSQVSASDELKALRELRTALLERDLTLPARRVSREEQLEAELADAVTQEDFERAARLRDTLDRLRTSRQED